MAVHLREHIRRHLFFHLVQLGAFICALRWWHHLPAPGYSVACLGVLAAIMSIHGEMKGWQKAIWMLLMAAFLVLEFRAIDEDRAQFAREQQKARKEEHEAFSAIATGIKTAISNGEEQFKATMEKTNRGFASTMHGLKEAVDVSTGRDNFCYFMLSPETTPTPATVVINPGNLTLSQINIWIVDDDKSAKYLNRTSGDDPSSAAHLAAFSAAVEDWSDWQSIPELTPMWS